MPQESRDATKAREKIPFLPSWARGVPLPPQAKHPARLLNRLVDYVLFMVILNQMVDQAERRLSFAFHALSDPSRRQIVRRLAVQPCTPSELAKPLHMSLQGVIKHVAVLERAGIIRREKRGRQRMLSLEGASLQAAAAWITQYRAFWETRLDGLAAHAGATAQRSEHHRGV